MAAGDISAVVLSAKPVTLEIPGVTVVPYVSRFSDAAGLLDARLAALRTVRTEWFFFLDDDDGLPDDYLSVLDECMAVSTPLAYTNEVVNGVMRRSLPYDADLHVKHPLLVHHLAVCNTIAARCAALSIPRGCYMVENLLFFEVAKRGATYVDRVGYLWNQKIDGLSHHPSLLIGQVQSSTWAARNKA